MNLQPSVIYPHAPTNTAFTFILHLYYTEYGSFWSYVNTFRLHSDLVNITQIPQARQNQHLASLNTAADYK